MAVKKHNIEKLQQLRANITSNYKQTASQVITLYKSRHIKNIGTAQRILKGLTGTKNRQQTALNLITKYKQGAPPDLFCQGQSFNHSTICRLKNRG